MENIGTVIAGKHYLIFLGQQGNTNQCIFYEDRFVLKSLTFSDIFVR